MGNIVKEVFRQSYWMKSGFHRPEFDNSNFTLTGTQTVLFITLADPASHATIEPRKSLSL
jgi:hypothetical protein